jgi:serine protein kinase
MSNAMTGMLAQFAADYAQRNTCEKMSMADFLDRCKNDPSVYASPAQRMLKAIGEPEVIDTKTDPRLGRIFSNRVIKVYPAFKEFYGMEEAVESIVSYFRHSAQGLEESKQILYLLGPVGGGKSSLAEKLKELMQAQAIYSIEGSPINDHPLTAFDKALYAKMLEEEFGIPKTALRVNASPWLIERLKEVNGDLTKLTIIKQFPSVLKHLAIDKVEPGDENNQDISTLVGKVDIRKLEDYPADHPYAYSYSGGLCRANQGILDFVEMFKAPIKMLHPLLTATQEKNFNGTDSVSSIPFDGIVLAHSNESEWKTFRNNKNNEAFLDRVYIVKVPYCLRVDDEVSIYKKMLSGSSLSAAPCAPETLEMMAKFAVMSRLVEPQNSNLFSKMCVYNGENIKNTDPRAKPLQEYKDLAGVNEGMNGVSTRFAFKILSKVFNFDQEELAANPIHLMYVLEQEIVKEQYPADREEFLVNLIKHYLGDKYVEFVENQIRIAFMDSYADYGQTIFDRYFQYADFWIRDEDFRDPDTNEMFDRSTLNAELEKIEKPAGIVNPKDFRNELVNFVLRHRAANKGNSPKWDSFEKMRQVIEKKMFASTEEILPVISFSTKGSKKDQEAHDSFVKRMAELGYTPRQTRLLVEWWMRVRKNK